MFWRKSTSQTFPTCLFFFFFSYASNMRWFRAKTCFQQKDSQIPRNSGEAVALDHRLYSGVFFMMWTFSTPLLRGGFSSSDPFGSSFTRLFPKQDLFFDTPRNRSGGEEPRWTDYASPQTLYFRVSSLCVGNQTKTLLVCGFWPKPDPVCKVKKNPWSWQTVAVSRVFLWHLCDF